MSKSLPTLGNLFMLAFLQCGLGVGASVIIGFVPEAWLARFYVDTVIEPFGPVTAATAFILGLAFSGHLKNGQGASFAWVFGLIWLGVGFHNVRGAWNPQWSNSPSSWDYAIANLFGPTSACQNSECLNEFLVTMPFTASVTYSIGAFIRRAIFLSQKQRLALSETPD
jgi:hypothetical protein